MSAKANLGAETNVSARTGSWQPSRKSVAMLLGLVLLYVTVRSLVAAETKPLFCDEIITLTVASQPGLRGIWHALAQAVDGQPPLFYLIEHAAMGIGNNVHISLRLPSIFAMLCTVICVFVYARKHSGEWVAFLCSLILLSTTLFLTFAVDARPYSMFIACFAFAMVCHQRLPSLPWAAAMAFSLALAQSLHYYAIFGLFAFGLSEAVLLLKRRRFRWHVWLALGFGVLPLLFAWPLLAAMKAYYGPYFWGHFGMTDLPRTYGNFFTAGATFGSALAAVCFAGIAGLMARVREPGQAQSTDEALAQAVLLLSLLVLPFIAFAITRLAHGGMVDRYVQETVLGISLALAYLFRRAKPEVVTLFAVFVLSTVSLHELSFWRSGHSLRLPPQAAPIVGFIQDAQPPDLPVVVADGLEYVALAYYASPPWANKFVYVFDDQRAVQYAGTDSVDKDFRVLRNYMPLHVSAFSDFAAARPVFLLYAKDPPAPIDWLPVCLVREGASLQVLAMKQDHTLYLVTMKKKVS